MTSSVRILPVENDEIVAGLIEGILAGQDCLLTVAGDGETACKILHTAPTR
jgi:CheY-like chemotaxis protein